MVARFDTIRISRQGPGSCPGGGRQGGTATPTTSKVCINTLGGYRNSMTVILTGLDIDKKARILEEALLRCHRGQRAVPEGRDPAHPVRQG
ncbi:MAG: DUF1446 domain-containing protein [Desulfobacterales bacterium]|nr:DUF1446 domain-containing protein [Desulfobacterales bacterium]